MGERRFTTQYQVELDGQQFQVQLRSLGRVSEQAFDRLERSIESTNLEMRQLDATATSLTRSFGGLRRGALAVSSAFGAISIGAVFSNAVRDVADFESSFNNVRTLLNESVVSVQNIRQELLDLPPVLGRSIELTAGLYQALSAGVEPANAVRFVGEAARFAQAALTDNLAAVDIGTTILNAFGKEASETTRIFDVLFKTIEVGKTTGELLTQFFGPVIPLADQLGISLEEVSAALATLTAGGFRTEIAVTALRSAFSNFIQNAQQFRDAGIEVREVIAERGLIGVFEELRRVTGGNAEAIREFVPDVRGLVATLALAGVQADSFREKFRIIMGADGATAIAQAKQLEGLNAAFRQLGNTWDRIIQDGTFVNETLETITRTATTFLNRFTVTPEQQNLQRLQNELLQIESILEQNEEAATGFFRFLSPSESDLANLRNQANRIRTELATLAAPDPVFGGPGGLTQQLREELETIKVNELRKQEEARVTKERNDQLEEQKRQKVEQEEARKLEAVRRAEEAKRREAERTARDEIQRIRQRLEAGERAREREIQEALRVQERFRQIQETAEAEQERTQERLAQQQQRTAERLARDQARAIEQSNRDLLRPFIRLGDDISETLSDAIVEGLFSADIERQTEALLNFLQRSFADFASRLVQQQIFAPLFEQVAQQAGGLAARGVGLSGGLVNQPGLFGAGVGAQIANRSTAGLFGTNVSLQQALGRGGLGLGAGFLGNQLLGLLGLGGPARGVLSGAGGGAIAGSAFGPLGALAGGGLGALIGGIASLFGGGERLSTAQIRTTAGRPIGGVEDEAVARSRFGVISFVDEATQRFDAARAADFVVEIDNAIAELLDDRQEQVLREILQAQGPRPQVETAEQDDAIAQIIFDRLQTALDAVVPGLSSAIAGRLPTAENLGAITQTFEEAISFFNELQALGQNNNLNEAEQALAAINERFDELQQQRQRFGIGNEAQIEAFRQQEIRQLTIDFDQQIRRELLGFTDPIALELELLEERRQRSLEQARTLNADINTVEERFAQERLAILERFADDALSAAQERAERRAEINARNRQDILEFTDPQTAAIADFNRRRREALAEAEEVGASLQLVEARFAAERRLLVERLREDFVRVRDALAEFSSRPVRNLTATQQAFRALQDEFQALTEQANQAGLSVRGINASFRRQRRALARDFQNEIQLELLAITDPLQAQLVDLRNRREAAIRTARELGIEVNLIERRFAAERAQIVEQFTQSSITNLQDITDFINQTQVSARGGLAASQRQEVARDLFREALRGTDVQAGIRAADQLLSIARERFGGTARFFDIQELVFNQLERFRQRLGGDPDQGPIIRESRDIAREQLRLQETQVTQQVLTTEQISTQNAILADIRNQNGEIILLFQRQLAA